jgi:cytochrome c biogenesis protein CcdA
MFRREDEVARAERFFDRGDVEQAAWILWEARRRALKGNDPDRLAEIETRHATLRVRLAGDDRLPRFDGVKGFGSGGQPGVAVRRGPAPPPSRAGSFLVGVVTALALLGAGLLVVLGVVVVVGSRNQAGGGGVIAGEFSILLSVPLVVVGVVGWRALQRRWRTTRRS